MTITEVAPDVFRLSLYMPKLSLDVILHADHVIDLGPGGGADGGRIVAEGPPEEVARCAASHTGKLISSALSGNPGKAD